MSKTLTSHIDKKNYFWHFCWNLIFIHFFPVFKNKGDCKNAKKYRGITVTPTLSTIIEEILKIRENGKILLNQNPLQKGFTKNSSPLLCELLVEEFERENKDLKRPTYIAM
jgi:hypothetical protein